MIIKSLLKVGMGEIRREDEKGGSTNGSRDRFFMNGFGEQARS